MKFRLGHSIFVGLSLMVMPHQIAIGAQASQSELPAQEIPLVPEVPPVPEYVIGPGDVLSVNDNAGSTTSSPILPDGTVVIDHAGVIEAAGMTMDALNKLVNESAKKWSERPNIVIKLELRRATFQVYVLGAVGHVGLYPQPPAAADESSADSAKKHLFSILEALKMAGGLKDDADIRHIFITRQHPKQVIDVDLNGETNDDLKLVTGDVIFVPRKIPGDFVPRKIVDGKIYSPTQYSGGYGVGFREHPAAHNPAQIERRSEHCRADIDILWETAQHLHPGVTKKSQIESTYSDFESLLQKAADELDTGEPPKSGWAAELITYYTRPEHKWPAVSPTLDNALQARRKLVQFTNEQTVKTIEQKLYRFASPEDKSKYYSSPDMRPLYDAMPRSR